MQIKGNAPSKAGENHRPLNNERMVDYEERNLRKILKR